MEADSASVGWPCDNLFRYVSARPSSHLPWLRGDGGHLLNQRGRGQRDFIREGAVKKGELAAKHCEVLTRLIEKEYASKIRDIKAMFPKCVWPSSPPHPDVTKGNLQGNIQL